MFFKKNLHFITLVLMYKNYIKHSRSFQTDHETIKAHIGSNSALRQQIVTVLTGAKL